MKIKETLNKFCSFITFKDPLPNSYINKINNPHSFQGKTKYLILLLNFSCKSNLDKYSVHD